MIMLSFGKIVTMKGVVLKLILSFNVLTQIFCQDTLEIITDFNTLKSRPSQLTAKNYFSLSWRTGRIYLFNQQAILDQQIRYDLDNNLIEIKTEDDTKIVEGFKVRRFEWIDDNNERSLFVNAAGYQYSIWMEGFYRILAEGKISLLERTEIKVETDNTTGSEEIERYEKDTEPDELEKKLYVAQGNIIRDLGRKKEILNHFGEKASKVEAYSKDHGLSFRDQNDLTQIVEFYNSLP